MQFVAVGYAFDGRNLGAVAGRSQDQARVYGLAVQQDTARTAIADVAVIAQRVTILKLRM